MFRWFLKTTGLIPTWFVFHPKYIYEDKTKQKKTIKGRAIIASNHKSSMDPLLMMYVFIRRYLHCVVGEVIYENYKVWGFFLKMLGSIKVDRYIANPDFLNKCNDILQHNGVVEIYPEGKLPLDPRSDIMMPWKVSVTLLSIQSNAPIIPVYHGGKYGFMKRKVVVIGKPINMRDYCKNLNPELAELTKLTKMLEDKVNQLKLMIPNETKKTTE
ncbi:MAG: 1-acyl-sn-glycerol-3-phosphate acyltransferase [Mycoplasmataceae bacterium]|nr:1-acyl-sn-glycerol-3-phosphate acyltransferase [Mycoplasmataceae bacterium]